MRTWTLELNDYERDNLLAALEAAASPESSPLSVLYTGDWLHQIVHKLAPEGPNSDRGRPNASPAYLIDRARRREA